MCFAAKKATSSGETQSAEMREDLLRDLFLILKTATSISFEKSLEFYHII